MALEAGSEDGDREIAREVAMPGSSASASVLLPFGSLMGTIPVDSAQGRVIDDFDTVLAKSGQRKSDIQRQIHSVIDPVPVVPRSRRPSLPSGDGGN